MTGDDDPVDLDVTAMAHRHRRAAPLDDTAASSRSRTSSPDAEDAASDDVTLISPRRRTSPPDAGDTTSEDATIVSPHHGRPAPDEVDADAVVRRAPSSRPPAALVTEVPRYDVLRVGAEPPSAPHPRPVLVALPPPAESDAQESASRRGSAVGSDLDRARRRRAAERLAVIVSAAVGVVVLSAVALAALLPGL